MLFKICQYFATNIRLLCLIITMIILLGASSLIIMPKAEDPQFDMPLNVVEVIAPGVSPTVLESDVVTQVENSLNTVDHLKSIETEIKQGAVTFTIRSLYGTDASKSYDDVTRAVTRVRSQFPRGVQQVLFIKASPITVNAVKFAVSTHDNDWQTLQRTSKRLQQNLQALPIVRQAEIWGLPRLVASVDVDHDKLIQYSLSIQDVFQVVSSKADSRHAGYVENDVVRFNINLSGRYQNFEQLANTVIKSNNAGHVLLRDIAQLKLEPYKADNLGFVNRKPVVFVTAQLKQGESIFKFDEQVDEVVAQFKQTYPQVSVDVTFDQEQSVKERVSGFLYDLLYGLILILFCLLFFMGPKQSFWVSLALPLTIFITLVLLNAFGFVLQQMTIAGIIVSLGLLVDNSLVVVEQFAKHKDKHDSNIKTIKAVLSEVGLPLVAGTLTTVLAFLPMMVLKSDTGDFMRALPVSVTIALLTSLLVALLILPALMSVFGVSKHSRFTLSHMLDGFAQRRFRGFLTACLRWPYLIILLFILFTAGGVSLLPQVGVSLFPKAEKNIVVVNVETPQFSSIERTKQVVTKLSKKFETMPHVDKVIASVGSTVPRIYYNHVPKRGIANYAQMMLLVDSYDGEKVDRLMTQIRKEYQNFSEAKVNVFEFQQGPVTDRPITIRVLGDDLEALAKRSAEIQTYLDQQELVFDVRNISGDIGLAYNVIVDDYKAEQANIDISSAESQIRGLLDGFVAGEISDKYGESFNIIVKGQTDEPEQLNRLYVINREGQPIPVSTIATVSQTQLSPPFYHYQRSRMNSVSADVLPNGNVAEITLELENYLNSIDWRDGLTFKVGGEEEARKENFGGLSQILIIVVLTIFIILFVQFKSFAQPGVIISLLPIAFAGGVVGMFVMGISFSMMAFIGLISLIGIMVNDAIIVVDGFNRGIKQSLSPLEAMVDSASSRFTPVILTSLTTVMGLLPLTLYGGDLWKPMGTVIITGLVFTTLASLIWVPVLTIKLTNKKNRNNHLTE